MTFFAHPYLRRFALCFALTLAVMPVESAWAKKDREIILRATGSGALLGLGAGLLSYPFAKSTGTIFTGVAVGAILGTIYGFYLVDRRDEAYRQASLSPFPDVVSFEGFYAELEARNEILRRGTNPRLEVLLPFSVLRF